MSPKYLNREKGKGHRGEEGIEARGIESFEKVIFVLTNVPSAARGIESFEKVIFVLTSPAPLRPPRRKTMISIYVPDVGDGLAAGLWTVSGERIQIDCGSQHHPIDALEKGLRSIGPDVFILSHFHADHYNGLQLCNRHPYPFYRPAIRQVFYPRLPEFQEREKFMLCMLAMAHRLMGDQTGSREADFLGTMSRINSCRFTYQALALGDMVQVGSSQFEVLWPPRTVEDRGTLKVIKTAILHFEEATRDDDNLSRIREELGDKGEINPYLGESGEILEQAREESQERDDRQPFFPISEDLAPSVVKANNSLRRAANHLSLAFYQDNRLLFLGDLERHEIANAVRNLLMVNRNHFLYTITPHHGTHWHPDLGKLRSRYALSSAGKGLFRHVSPEYKSMCDNHLITYLNGDITHSLLRFPYWHPEMFW